MGSRFSPLRILTFLLASAAVIAYSRRPPAMPGEVETLPSSLPPDPPPALPPPDFSPPQPPAVVAAIARAFAEALPPLGVRTDWAVTGDFNGDDSPDLVVPARPFEERLSAINGEFANWILQDPTAPPLGPESNPSPPVVVVGKDDMLLAVVHGVGPRGWRSPDARQAYLLKVSLEGQIQVQKRDALQAGAARSRRRLPYLRGDLIYEAGGRRFLYWTGARYAWHSDAGLGAIHLSGRPSHPASPALPR